MNPTDATLASLSVLKYSRWASQLQLIQTYLLVDATLTDMHAGGAGGV